MAEKENARRYDLRHVIRRATEMDGEAIVVDAAEVRAIAAELGLSTEAVNRALREAEAKGSLLSDPARAPSDALGAAVTLGVAGIGSAALGLASASQGFDGVVTTTLFAAMSTLIGDLWFASRVRGKHRIARFLTVNTATWAVLMATLGSLSGALGMTAFAIGAGAGGTILISLRDRKLMKKLGLLDAVQESIADEDEAGQMQFGAVAAA